jgi:hypothetical protein
MRALIILMLLALAALPPSFGDDYICSEGGPQITASFVGSSIECGRSDYVAVVLQNAGNVSLRACKEPSDQREAELGSIESEYEANGSRAIGITAELLSRDDKIEVLSGPQVAGSLLPGQNRSIMFLTRTDEGLAAGVYPFSLKLEYARQSNVLTSGEAGFPDVSFQYENVTEIVPLHVVVTAGPGVSVLEVKGLASPGDSAELEIVLSNSGDQAAGRMIIEPLIQPPFTGSAGPAALDGLDPGRSASVFLNIDTDGGAGSGEYPLPLVISYMDGGIRQDQETAALVKVEKHSAVRSRVIRPAQMVLISVLLALVAFIGLGKRFRSSQKKRKRT